MRLSEDVVEYFKGMADEAGVPYQSLIKEVLNTGPSPLVYPRHQRVIFGALRKKRTCAVFP